jgi:hypothetical protein
MRISWSNATGWEKEKQTMRQRNYQKYPRNQMDGTWERIQGRKEREAENVLIFLCSFRR